MSRACLDNHILIWGIRGIAKTGQEAMILRAEALFDVLAEEKAEIIVPAVVVGEFLAGMSKNQHQETLELLRRRFELPPYDVRAAAVAAGLWRDFAEQNPNLRAQIEEAFPGVERAKIKADLQILATALVRQVDVLYTHDGPLRTLAGGRIEVRDLPPLPPIQGEMFSP